MAKLTTYSPSLDYRIPTASYAGLKLLVTYGESWGRFDRYDTDLSILKKQNTFGGGSVELGYIRSISGSEASNLWEEFLNRLFHPNYIGVGAFMVPGVQTSLFFSPGWWWQPFDRSGLWLGMRLTAGARIQEALTQDNPTLKTVAYGEIGAVFDLLYEIYPPFAIYARCNFYDSVIRGVGEPNGATRWQHDSLFWNGRGGALTFGVVTDLAGILD